MLCLFNHQNVRYSEITAHKIHLCCERILDTPRYFFCNLSEHNTSRAEQGAAQQTTQRNTRRALPGPIREGSTALLTSGFAAVCVIMPKFAIGSLCSETCDIFQPSEGAIPDRTTRDRARPWPGTAQGATRSMGHPTEFNRY